MRSTAEVTAAHQRLSDCGLATAVEEEVTCCFAVQDKIWVDDPSGAPWEIYTVLDDAELPGGQLRTTEPEAGGCCSPAAAETSSSGAADTASSGTAACCAPAATGG